MQIKTFFLSSVFVALSWLPLAHAQGGEQDAKTYVFECNNNQEFVFDINPDGAWLFLKEQTLQLNAPSGLLAYNAPGIELQILDDNAILRQVGEITLICENNPQRAVWEHAKLNGVDFRAIGNEPGWSLEFIDGEQIVYIGDYNSVRIEQALPSPIANAARKMTRWEADELTIEVSREQCQDSMSGEVFESSVTVYLDGRTLNGCGRALH